MMDITSAPHKCSISKSSLLIHFGSHHWIRSSYLNSSFFHPLTEQRCKEAPTWGVHNMCRSPIPLKLPIPFMLIVQINKEKLLYSYVSTLTEYIPYTFHHYKPYTSIINPSKKPTPVLHWSPFLLSRLPWLINIGNLAAISPKDIYRTKSWLLTVFLTVSFLESSINWSSWTSMCSDLYIPVCVLLFNIYSLMLHQASTVGAESERWLKC